MNFEAIKTGFLDYLSKSLAEEDEAFISSDEYSINGSEISIFNEYSNEFKNYLVEEVGADISIFSKNINEILRMDFGKEQVGDFGNSDSFKKGHSNIIQDTLNFAFHNENVINALDTDGSGDLSPDEINAFLDSIETDEQGHISINALMETLNDLMNSTEEEGTDMISTMLNMAYENEAVIEALDVDGDGELSDEEKAKFEEFIKGYDGDDSELTANDIILALSDIINGTFSYDSDVEEESEDTDNESTTSSSSTTSSGTSTTSSTDDTSSDDTSTSSTTTDSDDTSVSSGSSSSDIVNTSSEDETSIDLENMTLNELQTEKSARESNVSAAKDGINAVFAGDNEAIQAAQGEYDAAREAYDEAVANDENISEELNTKREENLNAIEEKESTIDNLHLNINQKTQEISDQESKISDDTANISDLNSSLSSLYSELSGIDDDSEKAAVLAQIEAVEQSIQEAEEELDADKETLENLKTEKDELEDELETAETELTELETVRSEIEQEILDSECSQETIDALNAYNEAKTNLKLVKGEQLDIAQSNLEAAKESVSEVNDAIQAKEEENDEE